MTLTHCIEPAAPRHSTQERIREIEASVRAEPAVASHRWALAQALCVRGDWQRALQHLQAYGALDRTRETLARTLRELIRAERWREQVMAGTQSPAFAFDDVPAWMSALLDALKHTGRGDLEAADKAREQALDMAPLVPVTTDSASFEWIADSDTRFGPVMEVIFAGSYRWIALEDFASWQITQPGSLVDLVWTPFIARLKNGTVLHGYSPARYPLGLAAEAPPDELLLTGRTTQWHDVGRTGVFGSGQKTWATSEGDFGIFELGHCRAGVDSPLAQVSA